ncbi:MAG: F0F1 ATP synthase subunit alpha [Candidatus Omnitrophota bacterium]
MNTIPLYEVKEVGRVKEVKHDIIKVEGLPNCVFGQLVYLPQSGIEGLINGFTENEVLVIPFSSTANINLGEPVEGRASIFKLGVSEGFLGRVVNSMGMPLDGGARIEQDMHLPVFAQGRGVLDRLPIEDIMHTGIKIVDTLISIGRGQRELIIGDRQTGKTSIAVDTIINQKEYGVICIYCWIGGSAGNLLKTIQLFKQKEVSSYTVIVSASASSSLGEQYLAPYIAATIGEYFMLKGRDVLVVFDDLTKHAWCYRQLSLLLGRFPGREAYPGDIFYIHSQLMERGGRLVPELGGGTMTFLPIAETLQGDVTGYIQSNLVSMTDGQIYISADLFQEGFRPAIDIGMSVSRIGSRVQPEALKEVSSGLRLDYLQHKELLRLLRLRTRVADEVKQRLERGYSLVELFMQRPNQPAGIVEEVVLFYAFRKKILEILSPEGRRRFKNEIFSYLEKNNPELVAELGKDMVLTEKVKIGLNQGFARYCQEFKIF